MTSKRNVKVPVCVFGVSRDAMYHALIQWARSLARWSARLITVRSCVRIAAGPLFDYVFLSKKGMFVHLFLCSLRLHNCIFGLETRSYAIWVISQRSAVFLFSILSSGLRLKIFVTWPHQKTHNYENSIHFLYI